MNNTEFAYLIGMIVGKGIIVRRRNNTEIRIEIPHRNVYIEGMDAKLSVKASITDIKEKLEPLINKRISVTSLENKTILSFEKNNGNFLVREINRYLGNLVTCKDFRIHSDMFNFALDTKKEFLRGLADVTAHIRSSNIAYGISYHHRVYIEIPINWLLTIDVANLLMDLDIPVQTIDWGHPNMRDSNLRDYNRGKVHAWFREHQIKIYADEFETVGFNIVHKMRALEHLAEINRKEWDKFVSEKIKKSRTPDQKDEWVKKIGHIEVNHHKYYWETRKIKKQKPYHPMENDSRIHGMIREKHFNSWKGIAEVLGYPK